MLNFVCRNAKLPLGSAHVECRQYRRLRRSIATVEDESFIVTKMPSVGYRLAAVLGELFG